MRGLISTIRKLVAAAALTIAAFNCAHASEWRLSHFVPTSYSMHELLVQWIKQVEKDAGGDLRIQVYPSSQLGAAKDHYDMAKDGIVDMAYIAPGYTPGRFPILSVLEAPFLISDANRAALVVNEWYRQYSKSEMPGVYFCHLYVPGMQALGMTTEINGPASLAGKKIRSPGQTVSRFFSAAGAAGVQMPPVEISESLDRGLIQGISFPYAAILTYNLQAKLKYYLDLPFSTGPTALVIRQASVDALSPKARQSIETHCSPEGAKAVAIPYTASEVAGESKIRADSPEKFKKVDEATAAEWRALATPVYEELAAAITRRSSVDGATAIDDLRSRLRAVQGGF